MEKLIEECELIKKEIAEIASQRKTLIEKLLLKNQQLEEKKKEIEHYENEKILETMIPSIRQIEGFSIISETEMTIITKGIDKTDYTTMLETQQQEELPDKWFDLEGILKDIIIIKRKYIDWRLIKVMKKEQYYNDSFPPKNYYEFTYKTPENFILIYYMPKTSL
jgi:hypothetical protein